MLKLYASILKLLLDDHQQSLLKKVNSEHLKFWIWLGPIFLTTNLSVCSEWNSINSGGGSKMGKNKSSLFIFLK